MAGEFLQRAWNVPELKHLAPHILACTAFFNAVSTWVQWEVTAWASSPLMCSPGSVLAACLLFLGVPLARIAFSLPLRALLCLALPCLTVPCCALLYLAKPHLLMSTRRILTCAGDG